MVDRSSAQATALPRLGLRSPPLAELAKREAHSDRERPKRLASVKGEAMLPMLQESPLVEAMQLFWKVARLGVVNRRLLEDSDLPLLATLQANPLVEAMQLFWEPLHLGVANRRLPEDLDLRQTELRLALVRRPAARARLQDLSLRRAERFPVLPARARQYSRDPGPYAFSRGIPVAQKCNRAVRCGVRPISARCRRPRNRREPAGCDNRCSRSRRKRAPPVRPFRIAVEDRRRCRPPPFVDRDARFANLG